MFNFEKLINDIVSMTELNAIMPADLTACRECIFHPSNKKFAFNDDNPHCYFHLEAPILLCMKFEKVETS